jgi:hypothetical protein
MTWLRSTVRPAAHAKRRNALSAPPSTSFGTRPATYLPAQMHLEHADGQGKAGGVVQAQSLGSQTPDFVPPRRRLAAMDPWLISGSLTIAGKPMTITPQGGMGQKFSFLVAKAFKVACDAKVGEPQGGEVFEYGIVQNVLFDHIEERFSDGEMLSDDVGEKVDVDTAAELPFIHNNAVPSAPISAGPLRVFPSFTDVPSLVVPGSMQHCGRSKTVQIDTADRTTTFRAGLVARSLNTHRLVDVGAIATTYQTKWNANLDANQQSFTSTELVFPDGVYALSDGAFPVVLGPPISGEVGNALLKAEENDFENRCGHIP